MEKTITMPLSEYNKLVNENKRMKDSLKEKDSISFECKEVNMGMAFYRNEWNIVTKDEMIKSLVDSIKLHQKYASDAWDEVYKLKNKAYEVENKKWWNF